MSQVNVKDALDLARENAQAFFKKMEPVSGSTQARIRAALEQVNSDSQKIAANLKALNEKQKADVALHVKEAQLAFDDAARRAKEAIAANDADLKKKNQAVIERAREGLAHLSKAVAARRAGFSKPSKN